jgi:hypothetical protein
MVNSKSPCFLYIFNYELKYMWILVLTGFVLFLLFEFIRDVESKFLISESHVLCRDESREEDVNTLSDSKGHGYNTVGTWFTVKAADKI